MADSLDQLYNYIVRAYALKDELIDIDLNAKASETGAEIDAVKNETLRREGDTAASLAGGFRSGIRKARGAGTSELALSDQIPTENAVADALIRYLVSFGLAKSRSEEVATGQYTYFISVDWDKLRAVAGNAGVDFDQAMNDTG